MYEGKDLGSQILAHKAMAIVQQTLTSGSVLFSFQKGIFNDWPDAYRLIQTQISPKVEFTLMRIVSEPTFLAKLGIIILFW